MMTSAKWRLLSRLKEVAAELRLIEAVDLVAFIRTGQFGNVRSLVNASTEMYFKPGTMSFAESGDVSLNWTGEPSVVLNMEFHHRRVDVFFRLMLESEQAGVEIEYISFNGKSPDPAGGYAAAGRCHRRRALRARGSPAPAP